MQALHAAVQDLRFTSNARYDVQPAQRRIRVTIDLRVTNPSKDTATKAFFYEDMFVQVMPGASSFKVSGPGSPRVRVAKRGKQDVLLRIAFGRARRIAVRHQTQSGVTHVSPLKCHPCPRSFTLRRPTTGCSGARATSSSGYFDGLARAR